MRRPLSFALIPLAALSFFVLYRIRGDADNADGISPGGDTVSVDASTTPAGSGGPTTPSPPDGQGGARPPSSTKDSGNVRELPPFVVRHGARHYGGGWCAQCATPALEY